MQQHIRKVALGTGSAIKIECVREAFGPSVEVVPVFDALSGVPPQPIGKEQTHQGAWNRATFAMRREPDCDCFIGIENGMWQIEGAEDGKMEDAAFVVILCKKNLQERASGTFEDDTPAKTLEIGDVRNISVISDAIAIPPKSERPFEEGPNGEWSVLKDPHAVLTNGKRPRKLFLLEAVRRAMELI